MSVHSERLGVLIAVLIGLLIGVLIVYCATDNVNGDDIVNGLASSTLVYVLYVSKTRNVTGNLYPFPIYVKI